MIQHPGTVLNDRFLEPRGLSIYRLAVAIDVPSSSLERFRSGRTSVSRTSPTASPATSARRRILAQHPERLRPDGGLTPVPG